MLITRTALGVLALAAAAGCSGKIDRAKIDAYVAAATREADEQGRAAEAACGSASPASDAGSGEASDAGAAALAALAQASTSAFEYAMASGAPRPVTLAVRKVHGALERVGLATIPLRMSCDTGVPTFNTPGARKDLEAARAALDEAIRELQAAAR